MASSQSFLFSLRVKEKKHSFWRGASYTYLFSQLHFEISTWELEHYTKITILGRRLDGCRVKWLQLTLVQNLKLPCGSCLIKLKAWPLVLWMKWTFRFLCIALCWYHFPLYISYWAWSIYTIGSLRSSQTLNSLSLGWISPQLP